MQRNLRNGNWCWDAPARPSHSAQQRLAEFGDRHIQIRVRPHVHVVRPHRDLNKLLHHFRTLKKKNLREALSPSSYSAGTEKKPRLCTRVLSKRELWHSKEGSSFQSLSLSLSKVLRVTETSYLNLSPSSAMSQRPGSAAAASSGTGLGRSGRGSSAAKSPLFISLSLSLARGLSVSSQETHEETKTGPPVRFSTSRRRSSSSKVVVVVDSPHVARRRAPSSFLTWTGVTPGCSFAEDCAASEMTRPLDGASVCGRERLWRGPTVPGNDRARVPKAPVEADTLYKRRLTALERSRAHDMWVSQENHEFSLV